MMFAVFVAVLCSPLVAVALKYAPQAADTVSLGEMNSAGVTRYTESTIDVIKKKDGFYWADPGNTPETRYAGAMDLAENVTWGWHHPNGQFNTIPVGSPLIDGDMNIYLGSDDAVRKFTATGEVKWVYAPRGQLAASPTLIMASTQQRASSQSPSSAQQDAVEEEALRPDWTTDQGGDESLSLGLTASSKVAAGDHVEVKEGMQYGSSDKEFYRGGDVGEVTRVFADVDGEQKAMIHWPRTHHNSIVRLSSLGKRFRRMGSTAGTKTSMLVGTTTSGYVFAIDLEKGEELWVVQASEQIAGVKGAVAGSKGVVLAATDRCVDRYCYRYRNLTNPLSPGNVIVRGLSSSDGSEIWKFRPSSPVWNFIPQFGKDGDTFMFNDFEGTAYCLEIATGKLKWKHDGKMGTYIQSSVFYWPEGNMLFATGVSPYKSPHCNPFPAPGILPHCGTWPGSPGWIHGLNASSGRLVWQRSLYQPPASAGIGRMHEEKHLRLIVATGHNCFYNSPSNLTAFLPLTGEVEWSVPGPTLYTDMCAGDKEGGDVRRAMGGRAACSPGSWSAPIVDAHGDVYIGSQVGELQRWGTPNNTWGGGHKVQLLSALSTGVAFQDQAFALAPGVMAVSTCTSLIVMKTAWNNSASPILSKNSSYPTKSK